MESPSPPPQTCFGPASSISLLRNLLQSQESQQSRFLSPAAAIRASSRTQRWLGLHHGQQHPLLNTPQQIQAAASAAALEKRQQSRRRSGHCRPRHPASRDLTVPTPDSLRPSEPSARSRPTPDPNSGSQQRLLLNPGEPRSETQKQLPFSHVVHILSLSSSRKGSLYYPTPDLSKVEPRVCFPKSVYKPPRSRKALRKTSASPEPPLMFKSPAEIVKEVLLNSPAGPCTPPDGNGSPAVSTTVPPDFRCRLQASALLEQLQVLRDRNTAF